MTPSQNDTNQENESHEKRVPYHFGEKDSH